MTRTDETELLTALHEGVHEQPRWATFLGRLRRRTRADHVSLIFQQGQTPVHLATQYVTGADHADRGGQPDHLARLDPATYMRLRPGRVYDSDELADLDDTRNDRSHSHHSEIESGRYMRVTEPGGASAWVTLTKRLESFGASDSALLSALAPHLAISLRTFVALERGRWRHAVAEAILQRAGIGWIARGEDQRVIDGNATGERMLASGASPTLLAMPVPHQPAVSAETASAVMLTREQRHAGEARTAVVQEQFHLSRGEARLAIELSEGCSIAEAAAKLNITIGTARSYSKSLYAKTRAHGQADLVRLVLTSVAALA